MYLFQLTICYCGFRLKSDFKLFYLNPTHSSDGCTYANNWIESVLRRLIKCPQRTLKNKTDPENQSKKHQSDCHRYSQRQQMLTNKRTANLIILLLFQLKSFSRPVKSVQVAETTHKYTRERKMSNLVQKAAQLLLTIK